MGNTELIRRARELAALIPENAKTPRALTTNENGEKVVVDSEGNERVGDVKGIVSHLEADLRLIAAAPEMAHLLRKLADALERQRIFVRRTINRMLQDILDEASRDPAIMEALRPLLVRLQATCEENYNDAGGKNVRNG